MNFAIFIAAGNKNTKSNNETRWVERINVNLLAVKQVPVNSTESIQANKPLMTVIWRLANYEI